MNDLFDVHIANQATTDADLVAAMVEEACRSRSGYINQVLRGGGALGHAMRNPSVVLVELREVLDSDESDLPLSCILSLYWGSETLIDGVNPASRAQRVDLGALAESGDALASWIGEWLADAMNWLSSMRVTAQTTVLRKQVEVLLRSLQVTILDNTKLLAALAERDQIIDQLESQAAFLRAELRRAHLDPDRVRYPARAIRAVLLSLVVGYGASVAANTTTSAFHADPRNADTVTAVVRECEHVLHTADRSGNAHPERGEAPRR